MGRSRTTKSDDEETDHDDNQNDSNIEEPEKAGDKIAEARRDFDEAMRKLSASRRRSRKTSKASLNDDENEENGSTAVDLDDEAIQICEEMYSAAKADASTPHGKPALAKFTLLPKILSNLKRYAIYTCFYH